MTELKPELRRDVNGKLVTRWVKNTQSQDGSQTLPAPLQTLTARPRRANKALLDDLEGYLENYSISHSHPHADLLRSSVKKMSYDVASEFIHALWEDNSFNNPYDVGGMIVSIYGKGSSMPEDIRDTVFKNLLDIIPHYGMNHDSDNKDIIKYTRLVFDAVDGEERTTLFTEQERDVYQSLACITNHIFRDKTDKLAGLENLGYAEKRGLGVTIDNPDSISLLMKNHHQIDMLREALMERNTLHAEVVRELADAGVLRDGTL